MFWAIPCSYDCGRRVDVRRSGSVGTIRRRCESMIEQSLRAGR
jgi:hypothetical protein